MCAFSFLARWYPLCYGPCTANSGPSYLPLFESKNMFIYVLAIMCTAFAALFIVGVSFAIAGKGNRTLWLPVMVTEITVWCVITSTVWSAVTANSRAYLALIFWLLSFPVVLWLSARYFKRWRG